MKETDLIEQKAGTMDANAVREEIARIDRAMAAGSSLRQIQRYSTRRTIFLRRLQALIPELDVTPAPHTSAKLYRAGVCGLAPLCLLRPSLAWLDGLASLWPALVTLAVTFGLARLLRDRSGDRARQRRLRDARLDAFREALRRQSDRLRRDSDSDRKP